MNRNERIAAAIAQSGKKNNVIARECGITASAVTQWTTGEVKALKPENLLALARATNTRIEWLATGEGEMIANSEASQVLIDTPEINLFRVANLRHIISGRKLTEFADIHGLDSSYLSQILNGHRSLGEKAARKMEAQIGIEAGSLDIPAYDTQPSFPARGTISIPQLDTGGMGGVGGIILVDQPGVIRNFIVDDDWVAKNIPHCTGIKNLCIVTGFGDSMPDLYSAGDPVLIDIGIKDCRVDGYYFFRIEDQGYIKHLQSIPGQGLLAVSQNPIYRDWLIKPNIDFEVLGKVLISWKRIEQK